MKNQLTTSPTRRATEDSPSTPAGEVESRKEAVKDYIRRKIDACDKSQVQIAKETGFPRPNVLSMIKAGRMPIPLDRIPALARAIDTEPKTLLTMCLSEYHPEFFEVLREVYEIPYGAAAIQEKRA